MAWDPRGFSSEISRQIGGLRQFALMELQRKRQFEDALKMAQMKAQIEQQYRDPLETLKTQLTLQKLASEIEQIGQTQQTKERGLSQAEQFGLVTPRRETLRAFEGTMPVARPFRPGAREVMAGETRAFAEGMPFVRPEDLARRYETEMVEPTISRAQRLGIEPKTPYGTIKPLPIIKPPTYSENVRADVQTTIDRILSGEDYETEVRNLRMKHPTGLTDDNLQNLKVVQQQVIQLKRQAIQELKNAGWPTTPANIKSAMQQLKGR